MDPIAEAIRRGMRCFCVACVEAAEAEAEAADVQDEREAAIQDERAAAQERDDAFWEEVGRILAGYAEAEADAYSDAMMYQWDGVM